MHFTTRQKFILTAVVLIVGSAMLWQVAVRSEFYTNITNRYKVTSGLIAHYTFDGRDMNMALASAEVRSVNGSLHANMVNATSGRFATQAVDAENGDAIVNGTNDSDYFGSSVSSAGDVNADGYDDILVGTWSATDTGTARGRVYLFLGPVTGSLDAENATAILNGTNDSDYFGYSVSSAGDVNADGYDDILVGAHWAEDAGGSFASRGRAYLFLGPLIGSIDAENANAVFNGTNDVDYFGYSVSSAGDVNADGYDDLLIGAQTAEDAGTNRGRAYLFLGPVTGSIDAENANAVFNGTNDYDNFGNSVSFAGDVNADGYDDILVGAYWAEDAGTDRGRAYLFLGPLTGSVDAENAAAVLNGIYDLVGESSGDRFGSSVSSAGDVNADGYDDILVSSLFVDAAGNNEGRVFLFNGPLTGSIDAENAAAIFNGTNYNDNFGTSVSPAGDVNADGYDDILVGATGAEDTGSGRGRAYLFLGPVTGTRTASTADAIFNGTNNSDQFGNSVSSVGDVNNDGYDDILVGASVAEDTGTARGRAYLFMPLAFGTRGTQGKLGQGMEFEGRYGYVDAGNTGATVKSVSFYMKADDTTSRPLIAYNGTASTSLNSSSQVTNSGFGGFGPTTYINGSTNATTIRTGEWYHVVITDSTGVSASALRIGSDGAGTAFFDGTLDDVRFYDKVLSQDEIRTLALMGGSLKVNVTPRAYSADDPLGRGLAAHWSFDGPTMSTVAGITRTLDLDPLPYGKFNTTAIDAENANMIANGTVDGDLFGISVSPAGDVNADGYDDILVGAYQAEDTGTDRGRAYLFLGPLTGAIDAENADAVFNGTNDSDYFGISVTSAGDVNADGYDDILVGAYHAEDTGTQRGRAYLFLGPLAGAIDAENAEAIMNGTNDLDYLGISVSPAGDVNADGYDDILVGAYMAEDTGSNRGRAYLFLGPLLGAIDAENADAIMNGTNNSDLFGYSVSPAGDVNADGYDDILVGAYQAEDTGTDRGRAYLFLGPLTSGLDAENADAVFNGTADLDNFGQRVSGTGDVNADGYGDVLVSAYLVSDTGVNRGTVWVFYGPFLGSIDAENANAIIRGTNDSEQFGYSISGGGDVNADGFDDVLIGARYAVDTGSLRGRAYLFYGSLTGGLDAENANVIFNGTNDTDLFGQSISSAGDVNADGYDDILVGAVYASDTGTQRGRVYLFTPTATSTNTATLSGTTPAVGKLGQALDFNGTSDYVSAGNVGRIKSVSFWMKADDTTDNSILDPYGNAPSTPTYLYLNSSSQLTKSNFWPKSTIYVDTVAGTSTLDTGWHHVVVTSTSSIQAINFTIGKTTAGYFDGMIDDVRLFNRTLSLDDVRALNLMGNSFKVNVTQKPAKPRTVTPAHRMTGHWTFDGPSIVGNYATVTNAVTYRLGDFSTAGIDAENANAVMNGTDDQNYFSSSVSNAGDVNSDGYDDILVGAIYASDTGNQRGRAYLFLGPITGSIDAENATAIVNGTNDLDYFGWSVSPAGDINADGYDDILVGSYQANAGGTATTGKAYLFLGPLTGAIDAENATAIFNGTNDNDNFGYSVSSAGDMNADGYDDILVGALNAEDTGTNRGRAYLFLGPLTGSINAQDADAIFNGTDDSDSFAYSVSSAGDVNADGYDDILGSASNASDIGSGRGRAYLFLGPLTGAIDAENADAIFNGTEDADIFGVSASYAGDVNADGYGDIVVGAYFAADVGSVRGRAYLFLGPLTGAIDAENADAIFNGTNNADYFGTSVSSAGDVNADGYDDIVIGASSAEDTGSFRGRVYLFYGPLTGAINAENANVIFNGTNDFDRLGDAVSASGDTNADGYDDILVGTWTAEDTGTNRGRAYLFTPTAETLRDGTISGATAAPGKIGQAFDFNGTNSYISAGNVGNVKSISFWIKADDITSRGVFDCIGSPGQPSVAIDGSSQITGSAWTSPTYYLDGVAGNRTVNTKWHHVVITTNTNISATNFSLGRDVTGSYFDGLLDDVRIYNYALSADEVRALYLQGN